MFIQPVLQMMNDSLTASVSCGDGTTHEGDDACAWLQKPRKSVIHVQSWANISGRSFCSCVVPSIYAGGDPGFLSHLVLLNTYCCGTLTQVLLGSLLCVYSYITMCMT